MSRQVELGWLAGIVDGEGHISRNGIQVTSTDPDILRRCHEVAGGGVIKANKSDARENRKPSWYWRLGWRAGAAEVLSDLLPLLCSRKAVSAAWHLYKRGHIGLQEYEKWLYFRIDELQRRE